ncbi:MAG: hypothetical protein LUE98_04660 [Tannerellaceae bacterium]|nr:hypothetical protein [Tannerellaceae bacterium]
MAATVFQNIENINGLIDINGLNETAVIIRPELMMLPLVYTGDEFARMGVELVPGIQNKEITYNYSRYGNFMRPYYPGMEVNTSALGKIEQNVLEVFLCAGIHEDNIQNYRQNRIGPMSLLGTNKTYINPANRLILYSLMATWSEDLLDAFFFAKRKANGVNKYDCFDGIYTHILNAKAEGKISEARRNYVPTGPLGQTGNDDESVYIAVRDFCRAAHPALSKSGILNMTPELYADFLASAKVYWNNTLTYDQYGRPVIPEFPGVRIYPNQAMGKGDLMILSKVKIMRLGFDSITDDEYVKVRNIHPDANIVTYNIQARYRTSIRSYDPKVFCVNDGTLEAVNWSGDMQGIQKFSLTLGTPVNGTIAAFPVKAEYDLNDEVTLTATPDTGYELDSWNNGVTTSPLKIKMRSDEFYTATFKPE